MTVQEFYESWMIHSSDEEGVLDFAEAYASHVTAAQQQELERFKALDQCLPEGFAIGDDATAALAVELVSANERVASLTKERDELNLELDRQKKRVCIGGDVYEANRNQHVLHLQTETDYLLRAEKAEERVEEIEKEAVNLRVRVEEIAKEG